VGNSRLLAVENTREMFVNMEPFRLSDTEKKVYDDLFAQCDFENVGKVSGVGAGNLFVSSGLSQDVLNQVSNEYDSYWMDISLELDQNHRWFHWYH